MASEYSSHIIREFSDYNIIFSKKNMVPTQSLVRVKEFIYLTLLGHMSWRKENFSQWNMTNHKNKQGELVYVF